jgi:hypothetical protein
MYGAYGLGKQARVAMADANVPDGMDDVIARTFRKKDPTCCAGHRDCELTWPLEKQRQ